MTLAKKCTGERNFKMNTKDFNNIVNNRTKLINNVLASKAKEYAIGDRLYNFKRAAEIQRTTPKKALLGMLAKHLVSVIDIIEDSIPATEHLIEEKLGDAINYLILLEALLKEELETCLSTKQK